MQDISNQLNQIKSSWDSITNVPEDLVNWGFPGLTMRSISDTIGGMAIVADQIEHKGYTPLPTSKALMKQLLENLTDYAVTHIPGNPQANLPGLIVVIEQVRVALRHMLEEAEGQTRRVYGSMAERLAEATSKIADASCVYDTIFQNRDDAIEATSEVKKASEEVVTIKDDVDTQHNAINEIATSVTNQKENIDETETEIAKSVSKITHLKGELEDNKVAQENLFGEFERYRKQVNGLLEDANKSGLAGSFVTRKKELKIPLMFWILLFVASISSLFLIGFSFLLPIITNGNWEEVFVRLPLTAPSIWLGWFAARQYGFTVRLREDYAYKAASAMAFEGYKREAANVSLEVQEKLLNTAIDNFGDNPLRIFSDHANHASPVHEVIEALTKDKSLLDKIRG